MNAGYEPVKIVCWRKAMILWLQNKVEVLEYHSSTINTPSQSFRLPSVLRLKQYIRPYFTLQVRLSRQNIFLRDEHTCQYCLKEFSEKKLTIDHVVPLSKGGRHEWSNVVTACSECNNRKGDKSPEQVNLHLSKRPEKPRWLPNRELELRSDRLPSAWRPYLGIRTAI